MGTRNLRWRYPWVRGIALFSWALLVIPATDARALTFGEWATSQGWPLGYVTPATVVATGASINSLAGIGDYNWAATPTTRLYLYQNQIASIESGDFSGLGGLTRLYLYSNQITSIEPGAFCGLENLRELDLRINGIAGIESGMFTGLSGLVYLFLKDNAITSIELGDFGGLNSLTDLVLSDNQITSIEPGDFSGLSSLATLYLAGNPITKIESGAFSGLGSLSHLFLQQNTGLTDLNLEGADLSKLTIFDVGGDTGIDRVSLKTTVLSQTAFAALIDSGGSWGTGIGELPAVTELDLSGIDLSAITDLSPLYLMDTLTDLWLVDVQNMDADALDVLLDNLAVMEDPSIEGALYLTQADFDAFNTAGGGLLAAWDAEAGHHVEIIGLGDANCDGIVDDKDASILAAHWLRTGNWLDGDFNGDGNVNDADAAILAAHWGEGMSEESVPEPGSLALLAGMAVMGMVYLRRRKA